MEQKNYYQTLNVSRCANQREIKNSYMDLIDEKVKDIEVSVREENLVALKDINEGLLVLSNPQFKREHDCELDGMPYDAMVDTFDITDDTFDLSLHEYQDMIQRLSNKVGIVKIIQMQYESSGRKNISDKLRDISYKMLEVCESLDNSREMKELQSRVYTY